MSGTVNVNELLDKAYMMKFEEMMKEKNPIKKMNGSGLEYQVYKGYGDAKYKWELQFEKYLDFGFGSCNSFTFDSDLALGKFLFECEVNNGFPKGAKGIFKK